MGEARVRVWGKVGGKCQCSIFFVKSERSVVDTTYRPKAERWLSLVPRARRSHRPLAQARVGSGLGSAQALLPPGHAACGSRGAPGDGDPTPKLLGSRTVGGTSPRAAAALAFQGRTVSSTVSIPYGFGSPNADLGYSPWETEGRPSLAQRRRPRRLSLNFPRGSPASVSSVLDPRGTHGFPVNGHPCGPLGCGVRADFVGERGR